MGLQIDVNVNDNGSIDKASKGLNNLGGTAEQAAAKVDKLSKKQEKLTAELKELADAAKKSAAILANIKTPFSSLNLKGYTASLKEARLELEKIALANKEKLSNKGFMSGTLNSKATVDLQSRLNSEIEKQAKLLADIGTLEGANADKRVFSQDIENLKQAQAETQKLITKKEELIKVQRQLISEQAKANKTVVNPEASISALSSRVGSIKSSKVSESEVYALKKALNELNIEFAKTGTVSKSSIASLSSQLYGLETHSKELDKIKARLSALGSARVANPEIDKLRSSVHALNAEFAKTGKVDKVGIAALSTQLSGFEGKLATGGASFTKWGKQAQFAIGGVARSFGAMTYSYTMLAPLLAGMAVGAAVKEVYALGSAIEYSITYAVALNDALKGISAEQAAVEVQKMTDTVLNMKDMRQGPDELAKGILEIERAGLDSSKMLKTLSNGTSEFAEISKFAALGEMDMAEAIKAVVGQHYAFGESVTSIANKITMAASESATDIKSMSAAFAYTTELATVSKISFSELATAMALMANKGIEGTKAGTALRTAILRMQKPSEKLKGLLDDLGVSFSAFTEGGQVKDLKAMVTNLKEVTENLPEPQKIAVMTELFGLREMKAGAVLLDSIGEKWDTMWEKIESANGDVTEIQRLNDALANTATVLSDILAASYKQSLAKAYDPGPVAQMLKDLNTVVKSDMFVDAMTAMATAVNVLGVAITFTLKKLTELYSLLQFVKTLRLKGGNEENTSILPDFTPELIKDIETGIRKAKAFLQKEGAKFRADYGKFINQVFKDDDKKQLNYNTPNVDWNDKQTDKMSSDQLKQYNIMQNGAEQAAKAIERSFREISLDMDSASVSKYEQQLVELGKKAAKAVAESEAMQNDPDAQGKLFSKLKDKFDANMIKEIQKEVNDISFKHLVKEMEDSGNAAEILQAKMMVVLDASKKYNEEKGQVKKDESGNFAGFTEAGQKYYEAQLKAIGIYLDKTEQAKAATLTLNNEIRKMAEAEFGPKDGANANFFEAIGKGAEANLPILDEWDRKLIAIENQVKAKGIAEGIDAGSAELLQFKENLESIERIKAFQQIGKQIKELNFSTMIGGLQRAEQDTNKYNNAVNKVKASYLLLKEEAYKQLNSVGQSFKDVNGKITFGAEGVKQFEAMVNASYLFQDALRAVQKEIYAMKASMSDEAISFQRSLANVNAKLLPDNAAKISLYKADLDMIKQIRAEAEKAAKEGVDGEERRLKLLRQALSAAENLDTKKIFSEGEDASKVLAQKKLMLEIFAQIEQMGKDALKGKEGEESGIKKQMRDAKKEMEEMKKVYDPLSEAASGYGVILDTNTGLTATWSSETVKSVDAANAAFEKLAETIRNMPEPKRYKADDYDGARASGGSVGIGSTYLVGEKGPELFSPKSNGFIIPNDKLSGSTSRNVVDINLSFNGSEPVTVQGDQLTVEKLERAFRNKQRYAS